MNNIHILLNTQVLIHQGQRLLERCNRLIDYCGQEHWQRRRENISNEIQILRQEIDQYQAHIDQFKQIVKSFGLQIYEEIKSANQVIRQGNNATIGQGIKVVGSTLTLMVGISTGGVLGSILGACSFVYGSM